MEWPRCARENHSLTQIWIYEIVLVNDGFEIHRSARRSGILRGISPISKSVRDTRKWVCTKMDTEAVPVNHALPENLSLKLILKELQQCATSKSSQTLELRQLREQRRNTLDRIRMLRV